MIIKKFADFSNYPITIKFKINDKSFKYNLGDLPYIDYFNEIKLYNYENLYISKNKNKLINTQHSKMIDHNLFGFSLIKTENEK